MYTFMNLGVLTGLDYYIFMLNKKHLGRKKGETNQKQQLSDYEYIAT